MKLNLVPRILPRLWSWEQSSPYAQDQHKRRSPKKAWDCNKHGGHKCHEGISRTPYTGSHQYKTTSRRPQYVYTKSCPVGDISGGFTYIDQDPAKSFIHVIFFLRIRKKTFKDSGIINRKKVSGRPRSVTTEENADLIEELICSQEEAAHTNLVPCKIAKKTGISRSSIRRMIKRRKFRQFKRVKTP